MRLTKGRLIAIVIIAAAAGVVLGYYRGMPNDVVDTRPADYGYRCGDGTEFTLEPSLDLSVIRIVPATSVDYVREVQLMRNGGEYTGEGHRIRLVASDIGTKLELTVLPHETTLCQSMNPKEESLFNE